MRRVLALSVVLLLAGCAAEPEAASEECQPHGGVARIAGDISGGIAHDADAQVRCEDGTLFVHEGWNSTEVK